MRTTIEAFGWEISAGGSGVRSEFVSNTTIYPCFHLECRSRSSVFYSQQNIWFVPNIYRNFCSVFDSYPRPLRSNKRFFGRIGLQFSGNGKFFGWPETGADKSQLTKKNSNLSNTD